MNLDVLLIIGFFHNLSIECFGVALQDALDDLVPLLDVRMVVATTLATTFWT